MSKTNFIGEINIRKIFQNPLKSRAGDYWTITGTNMEDEEIKINCFDEEVRAGLKEDTPNQKVFLEWDADNQRLTIIRDPNLPKPKKASKPADYKVGSAPGLPPVKPVTTAPPVAPVATAPKASPVPPVEEDQKAIDPGILQKAKPTKATPAVTTPIKAESESGLFILCIESASRIIASLPFPDPKVSNPDVRAGYRVTELAGYFYRYAIDPSHYRDTKIGVDAHLYHDESDVTEEMEGEEGI